MSTCLFVSFREKEVKSEVMSIIIHNGGVVGEDKATTIFHISLFNVLTWWHATDAESDQHPQKWSAQHQHHI